MSGVSCANHVRAHGLGEVFGAETRRGHGSRRYAYGGRDRPAATQRDVYRAGGARVTLGGEVLDLDDVLPGSAAAVDELLL